MDAKEKEILFVNAKFKFKNKTHLLENIVYKHNEKRMYWNYLELKKKRRIEQPVYLFDIEIKARLGFPNKSKLFVEAKKSKEERNKITGQYD